MEQEREQSSLRLSKRERRADRLPHCGSDNICWDGVAFIWLSLNSDCLADWVDWERGDPEDEGDRPSLEELDKPDPEPNR